MFRCLVKNKEAAKPTSCRENLSHPPYDNMRHDAANHGGNKMRYDAVNDNAHQLFQEIGSRRLAKSPLAFGFSGQTGKLGGWGRFSHPAHQLPAVPFVPPGLIFRQERGRSACLLGCPDYLPQSMFPSRTRRDPSCRLGRKCAKRTLARGHRSPCPP
jgi:hypothetical protein